MKIRILSEGWKNFTGNFGFNAPFKDGVSTSDLDARQIARIAASVHIVDADTGEQVGPASLALARHSVPAEVAKPVKTLDLVKVDEAAERERLDADNEARKAEEAERLAEAERKAKETVSEMVIYTRAELEAIGGANGINGLREIATPLGIKGRGIHELVTEILKAQAAHAVAE